MARPAGRGRERVPAAPGYTRPYRGRLAAALAAMVVYGAATVFLAKLIKDIVDDVLVRQDRVYEVMTVLVIVYLVKGVGAYLSAYWMTDVGQLVVRDVRNAALRATSSASRRRSSRGGPAASCCRASRATSPRSSRPSPRRSATCCAKAWRSSATCACCSTTTPRLALVCLTSAPVIVYPLVRLGQKVRRTHQAQPGAPRDAVARRHRSVLRPPHRQGVRDRRAGGVALRAGLGRALPHQHEGDERAVVAAAGDGVPRRPGDGRRALVRQQRDRPAAG